jgi:hypothetical protein
MRRFRVDLRIVAHINKTVIVAILELFLILPLLSFSQVLKVEPVGLSDLLLIQRLISSMKILPDGYTRYKTPKASHGASVLIQRPAGERLRPSFAVH